MEVIELQENEFHTKIKEGGKVLVDCYATWCGPCKMLAPIIDEVAKEREDCKFYKLDVDDAEEVSSEYGIQTIPTLLLFEDGELKKTMIGLHTKDEVEEMIR